MSPIEVITHVYHQYLPPDVCEFLANGTSAFIGIIDSTTVLKYPLEPNGDATRLALEDQILRAIGPHPNVIAHKGYTDAGLFLERAVNGSLQDYILKNDGRRPDPTQQQRVRWCKELTAAMKHLHSRHVLHCDTHPGNVLLDKDLHVKLADFQGRVLCPSTGEVIVDGWSGEPCRYFCPREDEFSADVRTDLFALGSTIYFIVTGGEVFMDVPYEREGWREEVRERFRRGVFPAEPHLCDGITRRCWEQKYSSADEVLEDLKLIEESLERKEGSASE